MSRDSNYNLKISDENFGFWPKIRLFEPFPNVNPSYETTLCFDFQNVSSKFDFETLCVGTQNENCYILQIDSTSLVSET